MAKYKVEVDLKTCISTAACYATDSQHFKAGKNQQANVIGGKDTSQNPLMYSKMIK